MIKLNTFPILIFSRKESSIYLLDRITGRRYFAFLAHNRTVNPNGDPLTLNSFGPAPDGFLLLSPPDFISEEFRREFYEKNLGGFELLPGESNVKCWGEFEEFEMGRVRFALGSESAPPLTFDARVWERELLIHGGKTFDVPTKGCIRMSNDDIERLALESILRFRSGFPLTTIRISSE